MGGYTGQVTLPGYDNKTGLGVPDGPEFIQEMRRPPDERSLAEGLSRLATVLTGGCRDWRLA